MTSRYRTWAQLLSLILFGVTVACVTATPRAYRGSAGLPPQDPGNVEVFWVAPDFPYRAIGEVTVRACPACSDEQIESEVRVAVAQIGGDVAIMATDRVRSGGAVIVPGPYTSTVVRPQRRDLKVLAALREREAPSEQPVPTQTPTADVSGMVSFECEPPDAEVILNDRFIGTCPIIDYPLAEGEYRIRVEAPGYETWTRDLLVASGASVRVRAVLVQPR